VPTRSIWIPPPLQRLTRVTRRTVSSLFPGARIHNVRWGQLIRLRLPPLPGHRPPRRRLNRLQLRLPPEVLAPVFPHGRRVLRLRPIHSWFIAASNTRSSRPIRPKWVGSHRTSPVCSRPLGSVRAPGHLPLPFPRVKAVSVAPPIALLPRILATTNKTSASSFLTPERVMDMCRDQRVFLTAAPLFQPADP